MSAVYCACFGVSIGRGSPSRISTSNGASNSTYWCWIRSPSVHSFSLFGCRITYCRSRQPFQQRPAQHVCSILRLLRRVDRKRLAIPHFNIEWGQQFHILVLDKVTQRPFLFVVRMPHYVLQVEAAVPAAPGPACLQYTALASACRSEEARHPAFQHRMGPAIPHTGAG